MLSDPEMVVLDRLRSWRHGKVQSEDVPPSLLLANQQPVACRESADYRPRWYKIAPPSPTAQTSPLGLPNIPYSQ